jgi:hypothetical protein
MKDELDELKALWQYTEAPTTAEMDRLALRHLVARESQSAHSQFRRYLWFEFWLSVAMLLGLVYYFLTTDSAATRWLTGQLTAILLPFFYFYYRGFEQMKRGVRMDASLRDTLHASLFFWKKAVRIYFWGGTLLMAIALVCLLAYRAQPVGYQTFANNFGGWHTVILYFSLLMLVACATTWWLVDLTYGRFIRHLKKSLTDLDT